MSPAASQTQTVATKVTPAATSSMNTNVTSAQSSQNGILRRPVGAGVGGVVMVTSLVAGTIQQHDRNGNCNDCTCRNGDTYDRPDTGAPFHLGFLAADALIERVLKL